MGYMNLAIQRARKTMMLNERGPFGACIVKDGKIIAISSNSLFKDNNPTAHA